ncbi:MAG: Si-specific NAD(P)(+) transhydrogenase [Nitrospirales bacterium]
MTITKEFDFLCIGSGPAGQRAAVQVAKLGLRVGVIEKHRVIGGSCINSGTIPSKTFREAVLSLRPSQRAREISGYPPDSPPTMGELLDKVSYLVGLESQIVENQLARNNITLIRGDACFKDAHTIEVRSDYETSLLRASQILVAVGTIPSPPPGIVPDGKVIIDSDDILQLGQIPRTMVVIGAGVIGLEYASMFACLGTEVTIIDTRDRPLEFLDHEIVDELIHQMRNHNVIFRLAETVERLDLSSNPPTRVIVQLQSGKRHVSELAFFSVGRLGATAPLHLEAAGLEADNRGRLKVDTQFRTSVSHIFAAGDVIGYPSLAATSSEQGRLAACYAFGLPAEPMPSHYPIGIYAIPEISMVGRTEETLTKDRIPYEVGLARYREIARGVILGDDSGLLKMLFHRDTQELLGVHAIGTGATELIHIGQAVLGMKGGLSYFLTTVFNYPTLAECYKVAALDAYNKLRQSQ